MTMGRELSGDVAYRLFTSEDRTPFALIDWVARWHNREFVANVGYVISVIRCWDHMIAKCGDGRYSGVVRDAEGYRIDEENTLQAK